MFDPQKAEPAFLEIIKRMPQSGVEVLAETIRLLIAKNFAQAHATVSAGRQKADLTDPVQKPLAALHQTVLVHNRLHELGTTLPIGLIWEKAEIHPAAGGREVTVSHDTQRAMIQEARHQIARGETGPTPCPGCGATDPTPIGRAPLADPQDTDTPHSGKCWGLSRFLAPKPLVDILRMDLSNTDADAGTAFGIMLLLAGREGLSVPIARCQRCTHTFVAFQFRKPERPDASSAPSSTTDYQGAAGTSFLSAYDQALLPHYAWCESGLQSGASVFEFGCGAGSALAHHAVAGMRASGYEEDPREAIYACEVFRLTAVSDDPGAVDTMPEGGADCVICDRGLDRTENIGRSLDALCRTVAPGGHMVVVARNGELAGTDGPGAASSRIGGAYLHALTPAYLENSLGDRGFRVIRTQRSPGRLDDPAFPMAQRDPFSGMPLWSSRASDFVIVAKRSDANS